MKRLIRNYLCRALGLESDFTALHQRLFDLHDEMLGMRSDLAVTFKDEHSPERKAVSDRLGQRAIDRLRGEDMARRHLLGEL